MPLAPLTVEEANTIKQTAQADVYAQVETDLKEAARILPDSYDAEEYGRLTNGAVKYCCLVCIWLRTDGEMPLTFWMK